MLILRPQNPSVYLATLISPHSKTFDTKTNLCWTFRRACRRLLCQEKRESFAAIRLKSFIAHDFVWNLSNSLHFYRIFPPYFQIRRRTIHLNHMIRFAENNSIRSNPLQVIICAANQCSRVYTFTSYIKWETI